MDASQMFPIHMGEDHCCCDGIVQCVCGMWITRDVATELRHADTCIHLHTYTIPHTFYLAIWLIMASLGVIEEVQKNHFSFKKIFLFSWWFVHHHYYRINTCLSLLHYWSSSIFLPLPHVSRMTKKSQPSCGYCNKSNISTINVVNWVIRWSHQTFSLAHTSVAVSLCFIHRMWVIIDERCNSSKDG